MPQICRIYRSEKKVGAYLYVALAQKLDELPELLLGQLGEVVEVMLLDLESRSELANANILNVRQSLKEQGYFLQLPPGPKEFLRSEG